MEQNETPINKYWFNLDFSKTMGKAYKGLPTHDPKEMMDILMKDDIPWKQIVNNIFKEDDSKTNAPNA